MTDAAPPPRSARVAGVLAHTEVEAIDLGVHGGRRFRAQVEHRTLRFAWGRRQTASLTLGRRRPARIEAVGGEAVGDGDLNDGGAAAFERYDVIVPGVADPCPQFALRVTAVAGACWLLTAFVERAARGRHNRGGRA